MMDIISLALDAKEFAVEDEDGDEDDVDEDDADDEYLGSTLEAQEQLQQWFSSLGIWQ